MSCSRLLVVVAVLTTLVLAAQGQAAAGGVAVAHGGPAPVTIRGAEGPDLPDAPVVVPGRGDMLFYGPEFDVACALGDGFRDAMDRLARLAQIIERSGRTVAWTLGYNKTSVLPNRVDVDNLPHGDCAADGLATQADLVRTFGDPNYLPLADKLAGSRRQTYYRTDQHWTTVGGAVFAKALAKRLSTRLGQRQRYSYGTEQFQGALNDIRGIYAPETAETAVPAVKVRTTTRRGAWSGYPEIIFDHSWRSSPARRTHPGRAVIVGDSFGWFALQNLRPLFGRGRWMWYAYCEPDEIVDAIVRADTVVVEVYQLFASMTSLTERPFLTKLRRALREAS